MLLQMPPPMCDVPPFLRLLYRKIRVFLGIESRLPTVEGPRTTQPLALNATHPSATIPESPPRSSRHTSGEAAPEKTVTSQLPELSDAVSGTESSRPDSLSSGDGEVDEPTASAGGGVGGGVAAREIPSLRPELKVRGRGYNRGNGAVLVLTRSGKVYSPEIR